MKVVGVDLSGPRNVADTCVTVFEERSGELHLVRAMDSSGDQQIFETISQSNKNERVIVGIDAPLSYNPGGGDRESDRELRALVKEKGGGAAVMTPTMTRMVYLTLRGIVIARMLETLEPKVEIAEVHPGVALLLREAPMANGRLFERGRSMRSELCQWFERQGLKGLPAADELTDHFVASCGAALAAWKWALGEPSWRHPAHPPIHPYDFVC
jgi:predicted nuclease with RNAse H fold